MSGFLDQFRKKVRVSLHKENQPFQKMVIDDKIALGVLLWAVAQADDMLRKREIAKIEEILVSFGHIRQEEMPIVIESIKEADKNRIDFYRFTSEIKKDLSYQAKTEIIENLFRVACADRDLAYAEEEMIRKLSGLLGIGHKEYIGSKIKIKKEFGI